MMAAEDELSFGTSLLELLQQSSPTNPEQTSAPTSSKKRRNAPGTPDPDAEIMALSPRSLLATNRFVCEVCNKGFQRDQNLQLHRRGHNLPWKLKQRGSKEVKKKVYVCPVLDCVHHDPSRALGDLTGIKKHFCRKHGEKKWKCEKCSKGYAVESDWKAHAKVCGTREYRCDCGTLFSRKDSFITHRAFCDALSQEIVAYQHIPGLENEVFNNGSMVSNPQAAVNPLMLPAEVNYVENINSDVQNTTQQQHEQPVWPNQINLFTSSSAAHPQWALQENPSSQFTAADISTSAELPLGQRPDEDNSGDLSSNLVSFYTSSFKNTANFGQHTYVQDSSATGLLLKATQIGSTMSLPGFHAGTFGLNSNLDLNSNMEGQALRFFGQQNEYMGHMSSGAAASGNNNIMGGQFLADSNSGLFMDNNQSLNNNVMMAPTGGVYHVNQFQATNHATLNRNAQTRDFMGVGNETAKPSLQQGFCSMGLSMDLNQFDA